MSDRIRLGSNNDPMDSMFTTNHTVDLTRNNNSAPADSVGLGSLTGEPQQQETVTPRRPRGEVIHGAKMSQNVQSFDPTTLIPKTEKKDEGANELFVALDKAVQREKESITKRHHELEEKMYEDHLERMEELEESRDTVGTTNSATTSNFIKEDEDEDDDLYETATSSNYTEPDIQKTYKVAEDEKPAPVTHCILKNAEPKPETVSIKKTVSDEIEYDEEEMAEDLDEGDNKQEAFEKKQEEEMKDIVEGLKAAARETIRPKMKTIDLKQFKIADRGVKASTIVVRNDTEADTADWVMYDAGYPISMSGLTGPELIKLDPDNSNRNRLNTMKDIHKIIYDHVVDSKKPSFERWMKQTRYSDIDNIYFALYMATFHGSNFVSYQCPDCKKVFIKDIPFKDMVKFKTDDIETKVKEMMQGSTDNGEIEYDVELLQVSDKYVFGMRAPSLYNIIIETAGLPDNILEKYSDLIDTITYIDSVYTIDYTNMQLTPVIIPVVKDDPVKSTVKKIKTMYSLLKDLSSDEYYMLRGYIAKQTEKSAEISYIIPEAKCPDCDSTIPANEETTAASLLFTRHHLGAFANM